MSVVDINIETPVRPFYDRYITGVSLMRQKISAMILFTIVLLAVVAISGCTAGSGTTNTVTAVPSVSAMGMPSPSVALTGLKAGLVELPNYNITIIGGNTSPVKLSYADLESMDFVEVDNASKMKMSGSGVENTGDYIGVRMTDILDKAGVPAGNVIYTIIATDGYSSNYTQQQLQGAILGLKLNGNALTDIVDKNSIVLVEPNQPGPMWVMVPTEIDIIKQ